MFMTDREHSTPPKPEPKPDAKQQIADLLKLREAALAALETDDDMALAFTIFVKL